MNSIVQPRPNFNPNPDPSRKPYMRLVQGRMIPVAWLDRVTLTLCATRRSSGIAHTPPGIAFECSVLAEAERDGATHVEVENSDTGAVYVAQLGLFFEYGIPYRRGHDQTLLPMRYWRRADLGAQSATIADRQGEQLTLFAEMEAAR